MRCAAAVLAVLLGASCVLAQQYVRWVGWLSRQTELGAAETCFWLTKQGRGHRRVYFTVINPQQQLAGLVQGTRMDANMHSPWVHLQAARIVYQCIFNLF
jgi:hypothetical protein